MNNDPTEYQRPIEPMQAGYRNPYESQSPYDGGVPSAPPPPPKQRPIGLIVASVSLLCLVLILGGVIFGIMFASRPQKVIQGRSTATSVPTSTPVPLVSYSASDIYNDFSANGLGGTNLGNDNDWSCCTYAPEGGALVWTDSASGYKLDIATFKSTSEAEIDAQQLYNHNFSSTVVHTCLLSYDRTVPTSVLSRYVKLMQIYCN